MAKKKYLTDHPSEGERFELVRQFNLLLDKHYEQQHQIQFYAGLLKILQQQYQFFLSSIIIRHYR